MDHMINLSITLKGRFCREGKGGALPPENKVVMKRTTLVLKVSVVSTEYRVHEAFYRSSKTKY